MKQVSQPVVLGLITAFFVLGFFAGLNNAPVPEPTNDQNNDGIVNITDFSVALSRANNIAEELRNQKATAAVIEDEYQPVPTPYEPLKSE